MKWSFLMLGIIGGLALVVTLLGGSRSEVPARVTVDISGVSEADIERARARFPRESVVGARTVAVEVVALAR